MDNSEWQDLLKCARRQRGLVTRSQALECGLTRDAVLGRVERGELERVCWGVYRLASSRATWEQRALATLLRLGPSSALSHASAAYVLRFDGFEAKPKKVDVLVRHGVTRASAARPLMPDVVLHRTRAEFQTLTFGGLRATDQTRTLLDLAGHLEGDRLDDAVDSAQRRASGVDPAFTGRLEKGARGIKGVGKLKELLHERAGSSTDSPLEAAVFRKLRRIGLPRPVHQHEVRDDAGYVVRVDFAWPRELVALHVDGYAYHRSRSRFEHDRTVASRLTALGWRSVWVTSRSLRDRAWTDALREALERGCPQGRLL